MSIQCICLRGQVDEKLKFFTWFPTQALIIDTGTALDWVDEAPVSRLPWNIWALSGCPLSESVASKLTLNYFCDSVTSTLISQFNNSSVEHMVSAISYTFLMNKKQKCFSVSRKLHATYSQVNFSLSCTPYYPQWISQLTF